MIKIFSIYIWIHLLFNLNSYAQKYPGQQKESSTIGKISGTIIDEKSNQTIEFATISLYRNKKLVNGTITDEKGNFKLENITPGIFSISISFLGYDKIVIDSIVTLPEKPDYTLGRIKLKQSFFSLNSVVIEEEANVIENKIDRTIYNADKDVTSQIGDATDLLSKVPMVSVDMDGNVQLRGSSNVRILINGKPSGMLANNIADALRAIPADQIKSVEVITSPSAKYDAEGSAGIINIITKKNNIEGVTGNVRVSGGSRRNRLNSNLGVKKGRFGINSSLNGHYSMPRNGYTDFFREDYNNNEVRTLIQEGDYRTIRKGYHGSLNSDYDFNAYNTLSVGSRIGLFGFDKDNNVLVDLSDPTENIYQSYKRISNNPSKTISIDFNSDYRKTFKNSKNELFASFLFNRNSNSNYYTLIQESDSVDLKLNNKSFNSGLEKELTGQIDYTHLMKENVVLEFGAKSIFREISSDYKYEVLDFFVDTFLIDNNKSDTFNYDQDVYSLYAQGGFKFKDNYEIKTGFRFEYTDIKGVFDAGDTSVINNYHNLIPTITVSRKIFQFSNIRFSYNQRLQRPGLRYINPYVDDSDPKNISYGNPYLSPELTHNFELTTGLFTKKLSFNVSLYEKYTTDAIQNYFSIEDSSGVTHNTYYNIGTSNSHGINLFGQATFFSKLTVRGSVNTFIIRQKGDFDNKSFSNSGFQYNLHLNISYNFSKGFVVESFLRFNSPSITLQGRVPSFSMMNIGFKKEFWQKKGSVGMVIYNPINKNLKMVTEFKGDSFYQKNSNTIPFRAFGVTISYRFGKIETRNQTEKTKKVKNDDVKSDDGADF